MYERNALLGLLVLLVVAAGSQAYSLSRALHDVRREVEADTGRLYDEVHDGDASSDTTKSHFKDYVKITKSPKPRVNIPKGHRLELTCEADGSPAPRIYWVMGENPHRQMEQLMRESGAELPYTELAKERATLVIDCVTPFDQGLIHCVAISGDKMDISNPTVLTVLGENGTSAGEEECISKPSVPVIQRYRSLYVTEEGSTAVLPCVFTSKPPAHVSWVLYSGEDVTSNPRASVQPDGSLVISNLRWSDMNEYTCIAKSELGQARANTFLYPASKSEEKSQANAL